MSIFHSTLSRRDFMKGLGLAGTGLGAASLVAPVFHDTDEMLSSSSADWKRPWYVKELELEKPSVEVDWSQIYRPGGTIGPISGKPVGNWTGQGADCQSYFLGETERVLRGSKGGPYNDAALKSGQNGMSHRCRALSAGNYQYPITYLGPTTGSTPTTLGIPRWNGTPEENARLLRTAMIHFGAAEIGYNELTTNSKKLIRAYDKANNKPYLYEDVPVGYEATDKMVLPSNIQLYDFAWTYPMNKEGFRSSPHSDLQGAANSMRYSEISIIQPRVQMFMKCLGFTVYGYVSSGTSGPTASEGPATLAGLGEGGRNNGVFITPSYGPVAGIFTMLTDLPLSPTPPIDSGSWRFCQTCTLCADTCPCECISKDHEPTWEIPPIFGKPDTTHIPGKKQFWTNGVECWTAKQQWGGCGKCMGVCTFNTDQGPIHSYVRTIVANTGVFNGFLWQMGKTFGYDEAEDKEAWFDKSQPSHSFNSALVTKGIAY